MTCYIVRLVPICLDDCRKLNADSAFKLEVPITLQRVPARVTNIPGVATSWRFTMTHFTSHTVENAGQTFRNEGQNSYCFFSDFFYDIGVYVFQCRNTGDVLYIGESHTSSHPLGRRHSGEGGRIQQHYTPGDNTGTFRINWCNSHCTQEECGDKTQCSNPCNLSFIGFKDLVRNSRLIVFSFGEDDSESVISKILALESALIGEFQPTYNIDTPPELPINPECVDRAVACIRNFQQ